MSTDVKSTEFHEPEAGEAMKHDHLDQADHISGRAPVVGKGIKKPPVPQDYIVLGARSSRLMPAHRRPKITRKEARIEAVEEQRKNLLVFMDDQNSEEAIFQNISMLKPMNEKVSEKRYAQLIGELSKGYKKSQLIAYFNKHAPPEISRLGKSANKRFSSQRILDALWNLQISYDVSESSDVLIEKAVNLTRREMFIIMADQGSLPRSWTKGGARILINFDEQKIIIIASALTYDWIQASLHNALSSAKTRLIEVSGVDEFCPIGTLPLDRIQRLSGTFVEVNEENKVIVATSNKLSNIDHAKRMIVDALGYVPRQERKTIINDDIAKNEFQFSRVINDDSLSWIDRNREWCRLKRSRAKGEVAVGTVPAIADEKKAEISNDMMRVTDVSDGKPTTFTATFGHVLHQTKASAVNPSKSITDLEQTFLSNIPFLYGKASKLPLYDPEADTAHSNELAESDSNAESKEESPTDAWQKLLDYAIQNKPPQENEFGLTKVFSDKVKNKLARDDHAYLVQLKFVPNVYSGGAAALKTNPPIEMWFEVDEDEKCVMDSLQFASTEREAVSNVCLPSLNSDIKFQASVSQFLDAEQPSVQKFLSEARINVLGKGEIFIPKELTIDLDGHPADYMYHSMTYRRQIDLAYKDYILQLSTLEGGSFGGRRLEASLVLDFPEGTGELSQESIDEFIADSAAFASSISVH